MNSFRLLTGLLVALALSCGKTHDPEEDPGSPIREGALYYSSADELMRYDFKTRSETVVFAGGGRYTVSPGKGKFAWARNDFSEQTTKIQIHELGSPDEYQPVTVPAILESTPEFAPAGNLLGALGRSADKPDVRNDLLLIDYEGRITGRVPHVKDFAFSPDGKDLVISAEALDAGGGVAGYALAVVRNYRTPDQKSVTICEFTGYDQLPEDIAVSPNSSLAAYTFLDHLYVVQLKEEAVPRQVTESRFRELDPCWSPDGEYLVFTANAEGSFTTDCGEIRMAPSRPATPVPVPADGWDNTPSSPMQPVDRNGESIHSCGSESIFWTP